MNTRFIISNNTYGKKPCKWNNHPVFLIILSNLKNIFHCNLSIGAKWQIRPKKFFDRFWFNTIQRWTRQKRKFRSQASEIRASTPTLFLLQLLQMLLSINQRFY